MNLHSFANCVVKPALNFKPTPAKQTSPSAKPVSFDTLKTDSFTPRFGNYTNQINNPALPAVPSCPTCGQNTQPTVINTLPPISKMAGQHLMNIQYFMHPTLEEGGAKVFYPIQLLRSLLTDTSVQSYITKQKLNPDLIYSGLAETLYSKLEADMENGDRGILSEDDIQEITLDVRAFAKSEGEEAVTPVTIYRWLLKDDPTKQIDMILGAAGFDKDMCARIRKVPFDKPIAIQPNMIPSAEELQKLQMLKGELPGRIIGQDYAVSTMIDKVITAKAGYAISKNQHKPKVRVLMLGPSGVGKTEMAKAIADLTGRELIMKSMNTMQGDQNVAALTGAMPGYVGYGDKGSLADKMLDANEKTKNQGAPPPIILLDEIEKAAHAVKMALLQVLDEGKLENGTGETAYFTGTDIYATSNAGQDTIRRMRKEGKDWTEIQRAVMEEIQEQFPPEFLNRFDNIVMFEQLSEEAIKTILGKRLVDYQKVSKEADKFDLELDPKVFEYLLQKYTGNDEKGLLPETQYGARRALANFDTLVSGALTQKRMEMILSGELTTAGAPGIMYGRFDDTTDPKKPQIVFEFIPAQGTPIEPTVTTLKSGTPITRSKKPVKSDAPKMRFN